MSQILKYPRTQHLEGSQLGPGDEDLRQIRFEEIADQTLVVEEKLDGANCGISFDLSGNLRLQSRGHLLSGGPRETQFSMFKRWTQQNRHLLWECLGPRYVMYGEWLFAKHTIFYDRLPDYFVEFDIFDLQKGVFLDSNHRNQLINVLIKKINLESAPIVKTGRFSCIRELVDLIGPSGFISDQVRLEFLEAAKKSGQPEHLTLKQTDLSGMMEGLYIKIEENGIVKRRFKYVRRDFKACVDQSEGHWMNRPIIQNLLAT